MKKYAVLDNSNKVINIIVADSLDIAERVTQSNCVLVTDSTNTPHFGLSYADGVFEQPPAEVLPE
jgi:hypothetical protein